MKIGTLVFYLIPFFLKKSKKIDRCDRTEGDVYGFKSEASQTAVDVESSVTKKIEFETGDTVSFKQTGKLVEGKIVGINANGAVVEYKNITGKLTKKEIPFDDLTKIER